MRRPEKLEQSGAPPGGFQPKPLLPGNGQGSRVGGLQKALCVCACMQDEVTMTEAHAQSLDNTLPRALAWRRSFGALTS